MSVAIIMSHALIVVIQCSFAVVQTRQIFWANQRSISVAERRKSNIVNTKNVSLKIILMEFYVIILYSM